MPGLNLSLWSVRNPSVTLFLILVALAAGTCAYLNLGRAEDPTFTIKTMVVQAIWPGATAEEMQSLVVEPIEKRTRNCPNSPMSAPIRAPVLLSFRSGSRIPCGKKRRRSGIRFARRWHICSRNCRRY